MLLQTADVRQAHLGELPVLVDVGERLQRGWMELVWTKKRQATKSNGRKWLAEAQRCAWAWGFWSQSRKRPDWKRKQVVGIATSTDVKGRLIHNKRIRKSWK